MFRQTITTHFEVVSVQGQKSGKCLCGKRRTRKYSFENTINPWNKNPDGSVKTRADIIPKLKEERDEWMLKPITCDNCRTPGYWDLSKEQREEYDTKGSVKALTKGGIEVVVINKKFENK